MTMLHFKKLSVPVILLLVAWLSFSGWLTIPSTKAGSFNLYVKNSTQTLGDQTCYLMSDVPPSQNGVETIISKGITNAGDERTFCRSILSLSGIASIDSATWTIKFRHRTSVTIKTHQLKVHFYILKSDGSVRQDLGIVTLGTWDNHNTWVTRTYNYNFGGYTVVDQTDYFAVDWIHKSVDGAGYSIYFMLDSPNVADSENSQIANFNYPSNAVPTIGEFQAPSTVYANKYFLLNATVNDNDGAGQILNATVQLSNSVVLKWEKATDTFSKHSDPNNYCILDASNSFSASVNSTAYKLTWKIMLMWAYPEGSVDVVVTDTKVFDSEGASGSGSKAGLFIFEDDLIVDNAYAVNSRVNPFQFLTFIGVLYYEGTVTPPENISGITVEVNLGTTLKGSTTSIDSNGVFSISFNAESDIDLYAYTVYATTDENTVQNRTVNVIVDGIKLSEHVVDLENEIIYVRALYAYDGNPIINCTISYSELMAATNSTGWAQFDTTTLSNIHWATISYGVYEPNYGLIYKHTNQTIAYEKKQVPPFCIKSENEITNSIWDSGNKTLYFNGNGIIKVDVGDWGVPSKVELNGNLWTDWSFDNQKKKVTIYNAAGFISIYWEHAPWEPPASSWTPPMNFRAQIISLGEIPAGSTKEFTINIQFDIQIITIEKIEFQAKQEWFEILTSLPITASKGLEEIGTTSIEVKMTIPKNVYGFYDIPFTVTAKTPQQVIITTISFVRFTITGQTSVIENIFTVGSFTEIITRLLGNPILLLLLIALIIWLASYSLKKH